MHSKDSDNAESYRRASERLIVLLSSSHHQIDILEDKEERRLRPRYAFIGLGKAIDLSIQHVLGVSPRALAHIIPPEKGTINANDLDALDNTELQQLTASYDTRFAVAERHVYLRGPRELLGISYRYVRGLLLSFAVKLLRTYRGQR